MKALIRVEKVDKVLIDSILFCNSGTSAYMFRLISFSAASLYVYCLFDTLSLFTICAFVIE